MPETVIAPPAVEPVTLEEMMLWMRLDDDSEEELVRALIATARVAAENYTGRAFITQTIRHAVRGIRPLGDWEPGYYRLPVTYFDAALPASVPLPRRPVRSIAGVTTYDASDVGTPYPGTNYRLAGDVLTLNAGAYWPSGRATVDYVAGYGDTPESVPAPIRTAIKIHAAALHEDRGMCSGDVPPKCQHLLRQYTIDRL